MMTSSFLDFYNLLDLMNEGFIAFGMAILIVIGTVFFIGLFVGIVSSFGVLVSNQIITRIYKREVLSIRPFALYRSSVYATVAALLASFALLILTKSFLFATLIFFAIAFGSYWTFFRADVLHQTKGTFFSRLKQNMQFFALKLMLASLGSFISYFPLYSVAHNYAFATL